MIFKYELTGYGWAEASFFLLDKEYHYNVSYIGESLYELLYGIIEILHINPGEPPKTKFFN